MRILIVPALLVLVLLAGCSGNGSYSKGEYLDPDSPTPVGDYYSDTDLKIVTQAMFQSLVAYPTIANATKPPVLMVMMMENRTRDKIDMEDLSNKISTALIKTGKVQFVNRKLRAGLIEEYDYSASGMVDPSTAKGPGRQVAPDFILSGHIASIEMPQKKDKRVYYRLTLMLTNVSTNLIVWQDEKEIKKLLQK